MAKKDTPEAEPRRPWKRTRKGDGATDVKVPASGQGNTKSDQAWLEEQMAAGLIEDIDPDTDEDIPFGALKRFVGGEAAVGSSWQLPPEDRRCTARSKIRDSEGRYIIDQDNKPVMRPCRMWTILGGTVCVRHGGGIERVRAAAQLRLAGAADRLIGELIKIALDDNEEGKVKVAAINSALDRAGVKQGVEVQLSGIPGWQKALGEAFGGDDGE